MYVLFYGGLVISQFSDEELKSFARRMKERWILAAYLITTTTYSLDLFTSQAFMYIFLVVCTCMIVKAAFDDQSFLHSIFSAQWLRSIGRVSYSFYLLHSVIIVSFFFFLEKNFTDVNKHNLAVLSLPIVLSATLIASTLLYRLVEQPYFHRKQKFAKPDVLSPIFAGERRVLDGTEPRAN
jgi:peptidoglycan/LPS O-acetylase OafA/YrhL